MNALHSGHLGAYRIVLCAALAALAAGTVALDVRSHFRTGRLMHSMNDGAEPIGYVLTIDDDRGRMIVTLDVWGFPSWGGDPAAPLLPTRRRLKSWGLERPYGLDQFELDRKMFAGELRDDGPDGWAGVFRYDSMNLWKFGFLRADMGSELGYHSTVREWAFPMELPALLFTAFPALAIRRAFRRRNRRQRGRCLDCGYDLRASTGRCSECGTPIVLKLDVNAIGNSMVSPAQKTVSRNCL